MKMHILPHSILGLCLLVHGTLNAQATLSPAERGVWQEELRMVEFLNAGNIEGFMGQFHEDFVGWSRNESKPGRKSDMRKGVSTLLRDSMPRSVTINRVPLSVRIYGDVAIVFYREKDSRIDGSGKHVESSVHTIHTWKRTADGWKLIGGMSTVETATPGAAS